MICAVYKNSFIHSYILVIKRCSILYFTTRETQRAVYKESGNRIINCESKIIIYFSKINVISKSYVTVHVHDCYLCGFSQVPTTGLLDLLPQAVDMMLCRLCW